jgi:hypothetical protein
VCWFSFGAKIGVHSDVLLQFEDALPLFGDDAQLIEALRIELRLNDLKPRNLAVFLLAGLVYYYLEVAGGNVISWPITVMIQGEVLRCLNR